MPVVEPPLTLNLFRKFYTPLVFTSLLTLLVQPLGSAALSRMPAALPSLAVWPVLSGFTFMLRSIGVAYNEVVVALLDEPLSTQSLRRFTAILIGFSTTFIALIALTPLSLTWFRVISGLTPELADMGVFALVIAVPTPGLAVLQSWFQGILLHGRRTRAITEAVVIFLVTCTAALWIGVTRGEVPGLYWGIAAFTLSMFTQTIWLWIRSRADERSAQARDEDISLQTPLESSAQ